MSDSVNLISSLQMEGTSAVSSAIQEAIEATPPSSPSPDLTTLTDSAVDAVTSETASGVSMAALGELGNTIVTAERLIATMPPYLGSGVDTAA